MGHFITEGRARAIPIIGLDYSFVSKAGVFSRDKWALQSDQVGQKIPVLKRTPPRGRFSIFAHTVPRKGSDDAGYAVDCLLSDIKWLGATRVILKSD